MAQTLSTPVVLNFHSTDTQNQLTVTRHMVAFRKATREAEGVLRTPARKTFHSGPSCGPPSYIPAPNQLQIAQRQYSKPFRVRGTAGHGQAHVLWNRGQ